MKIETTNPSQTLDPIGISYEEILSATKTPATEPAALEVEPTTTQPIAEAKSVDEPKPEGETKKPAREAKKTVFLATGSDGKSIELPKDLKIKKMVEGVEREVTLDQALQHYAFDVNYNKKYSELGEQKKEAKEELRIAKEKEEKVNQSLKLVGVALNETAQALATGDISTFIAKYADLTQLPISKIRTSLRQAFLPEMQKYLAADETERKVLDAEERARYIEEDSGRLKAQQQLAERIESYKQYAIGQLNQAGVSAEEFASAEKAIIREYFKGQKPNFALAEPYQIQQYVEATITMALGNRQDSKVDELINKVAPEFAKTNEEQFVEVKKTIAPFVGQLEEGELIEVLKQVLAQESSSEEEEVEVIEDKPKSPFKKTTSTGVNRGEEWDPLSVYR